MTLTGKLAIVFSVLLAVAVVNSAIIYGIQSTQRTDAAIVDAAGRNRMLSQRIGLLSEQVLLGHDGVRPELEEIVRLHDTSFQALRDGGVAPGIANDRILPPTIEKIRPLTDRVEELWLEYKRKAEAVATEPRLASGAPSQTAIDALEFIEMNASEMLQRNDNLTKAYVTENESKQLLANLALLAVLLINAVFIGLGFAIARALVRVLQSVDKAKSEFVSLAAHQLLTPTTSIKWTSEMLLDGDFGALNPKQNEAISEIAHTNQRMQTLVKGFLNLSRIELGVFAIEPEPIYFVDICESVIGELKPHILEKNHSITKRFEPGLPPVPADPNLLRIIFQNYLSNAVKYAPLGGGITVAIRLSGNSIILSVANSGPGIPLNDQSKIFSKMFRAGNASEIDPDGNGLGLYLVKEIVRSAGGRVWFESIPDQNTVFYASFPLTGMKHKSGTKALS